MFADSATVLADTNKYLGYGATLLGYVISSAGFLVDIEDSNANWVTGLVAAGVLGGIVLTGIAYIKRLVG